MKLFSKKETVVNKRGKEVPRYTLSWLGVLAALLLSGCVILGVTLMIQQGSVVTLLRGFIAQPRLIVLNAFPLGMTLLILSALLRNVFYGAAGTAVIWNIMSLVNLIKCESRSDPFVPADLFLFREAMNAMGEYQLNLHPVWWLLIVLCAAMFVLFGLWFKTPRIKWPARLGVGLAAAVMFAAAVPGIYTNTALYNGFTVSYRYNIAAVFNELGFPYCFLYNCNMYPIEKPEGYSKAEVQQWIAEYEVQSSEQMPEVNVIMVMAEAFSDISEADVFAYGEANDPLYYYKQLAAQPNTISGHMVVSNYGAGTANTEFDVMTGMRTSMIAENASSAFRVVRRKTNSLGWIFSECGYNTYFMHPGQPWFYNRTSVYSHFGMDEQVYVDAYGPEDYKGTMISDAAFLEQLESDLTGLLQEDAPVYGYTVTIQNHQAYPYSKYDVIPEPAPLQVEVSDATMETLSVYMEGVKDSSVMLYELTEFLNATQEPTIVVFFGDHMPNLGQDYSVYRELGMTIGETDTPEKNIATYTTPYIIWANDAYCSNYDFAAQAEALDLPQDNLISDIYLGALVYELLDMNGRDAYYDFLCEARTVVPVLCMDSYRLADGTFTNDLPADEAAVVEKMHCWVYYRLKDEMVK